MLKNASNRVVLVSLMLVLATLACNPLNPLESAAQPTVTLIPTPGGDQATQPPAGDDGSDQSGDTLDYTGVDVSSLSSYRSQFTMIYSGTDKDGKPVEGTVTATIEHTANPPATRTVMDTSGMAGQTESFSFQMIQIGDANYMITSMAGAGEQCLNVPQESALDSSPMFSPDTFLSGSDLSKAHLIGGDETVNGVPTRHYRATESDVELASSGLTSYTIDVWVAVDGGYAVRSTMVADGDLTSAGANMKHLEWTYDLLDINGPVTVELPAGCPVP